MVRCDDLEKRHLLLHNALSYLLKFDEALLAEMHERFRSVGKMEVPHRRGKGGRPQGSQGTLGVVSYWLPTWSHE